MHILMHIFVSLQTPIQDPYHIVCTLYRTVSYVHYVLYPMYIKLMTFRDNLIINVVITIFSLGQFHHELFHAINTHCTSIRDSNRNSATELWPLTPTVEI